MHPYFELHILGIKFSIAAYALFACIGLFFLMMLIYKRIFVLKITFNQFLILILFLALGVGIGSKALFVLTKIEDIIANFSILYLINAIVTSGFVFYGGLFGAIIGTIIFSKVFKFNSKRLMNIVTPAFPLFHIFGRIGCFFAGCCYGKEAQWGVALKEESDVLRVPIQLIESGCLVVIFICLLYIEKIWKEKIQLLPIYLGSYAVVRFALEFYRGDEIRGVWFGISTSQWVSICILISIIIYYFYKIFKHKRGAK